MSLNFEDILENTGGFGKFQFLVLVIVLGFEIPIAFVGFVPIFTGTLPEYWLCNGVQIGKMEACNCNGTLAAPAPFTSVVAEWNLVCDYAWIPDFINSAQMMGMIVGVLSASQLSDWYGRKYCTFGSAVFLGLGSFISVVAPYALVYAIGRVICGAAFAALLNLTGIYAMEFMPVNRRALCGCAGPYGWATMSLAIIAYFVRPWRTLFWITTSPLLVFCPLLLIFMPESPRILMRQGRFEEAAKSINVIAKINGCQEVGIDVIRQVAENEKSNSVDNQLSCIDLFRQSDLRKKTLCFSSILFSWAMLYFGIFFNIKNLPGNIYVSAVCLGVSDVVGFPAASLIMDRFGRSKSVVLTMSLAASVMVILAGLQLILELPSLPIVVLVLCTAAKFFMAMARSVTKCFVGESYPTDIRAIAGAFIAIPSSTGAALSPQVAFVGTVAPSVPFFVFAAIGISGSIFSLFITETSGKPLQDSIARKLSRRISIMTSVFSPTKEDQKESVLNN